MPYRLTLRNQIAAVVKDIYGAILICEDVIRRVVELIALFKPDDLLNGPRLSGSLSSSNKIRQCQTIFHNFPGPRNQNNSA